MSPRNEELCYRQMQKGLIFMQRILAPARIALFGAIAIIATATTTHVRTPFRTWERVSDQPIITPQGNGFESAGTFNPAVVKYDGKFVMLYRAQDSHGKSSLGYATPAAYERSVSTCHVA